MGRGSDIKAKDRIQCLFGVLGSAGGKFNISGYDPAEFVARQETVHR